MPHWDERPRILLLLLLLLVQPMLCMLLCVLHMLLLQRLLLRVYWWLRADGTHPTLPDGGHDLRGLYRLFGIVAVVTDHPRR